MKPTARSTLAIILSSVLMSSVACGLPATLEEFRQTGFEEEQSLVEQIEPQLPVESEPEQAEAEEVESEPEINGPRGTNIADEVGDAPSCVDGTNVDHVDIEYISYDFGAGLLWVQVKMVGPLKDSANYMVYIVLHKTDDTDEEGKLVAYRWETLDGVVVSEAMDSYTGAVLADAPPIVADGQAGTYTVEIPLVPEDGVPYYLSADAYDQADGGGCETSDNAQKTQIAP